MDNSKFKILPQFADFQEQVNLPALMDFIITASGIDSDKKGFGIPDLLKFNATWVLSRFALEIDYFPKTYETITVETWVHEVHTSNTIRNFRLRNSKNEVFGKAVSVWAIIDLNTRRAIPLSVLEEIDKYIVSEETGIVRPLKLDEIINEPIHLGSVKYSDIDINQHVNTKHYIKWMMDTFSLDELKQNQVCRMDLNFINEILYGDKYSVHKEKIEKNDFRFDIKVNDKSSCRGRLKFK